MKLTVDADGCTGHGRCYTVAPDLLTYDAEGYVSIRGELISIPEQMVAVAEEAAATCPEEAISLIPE